MSQQNRLSRLRPESIVLWTLALVVGVFGIWLGIAAYRARQDRETVTALMLLHPDLTFNLASPFGLEWPKSLLGLDFDTVVELSMKTTGPGAAADFRGLDDAMLEQVASFSNLKKLTIKLAEAATPLGIQRLTRLHRLESLEICGTWVSPIASLAELKSLTRLNSLRISKFPAIGRSGIAFVAEMPSLWTLGIDRCEQLSITDLPVLKHHLFGFTFSDCQPIVDADLEHLSHFAGVSTIELWCPVQNSKEPSRTFSDDGLSALGKLPGLHSLRVGSYDSSHVSQQAIDDLKRSHPGMSVDM
jgi:hypothetical protein